MTISNFKTILQFQEFQDCWDVWKCNWHWPSSSSHCCFCRFFWVSKRFASGTAAYKNMNKKSELMLTRRATASA